MKRMITPKELFGMVKGVFKKNKPNKEELNKELEAAQKSKPEAKPEQSTDQDISSRSSLAERVKGLFNRERETNLKTEKLHVKGTSFFSKIFSKFKKDKIKKDIEKIEKITEKEKKIEAKKEQIRKKLFSETPIKKKKKPRKKFKLKELLRKAGVQLEPQEFRKRIAYAIIVLTLLLTIVVLLFAIINKKTALDLLIFFSGFWTVGFAFIIVFTSLSVSIYLDMRIHQRRQEVERVLPDYLLLTASNIGAGMTIDRALWYAVRPKFGILAKEIEDVAKRVITGEELDVALTGFSDNYDSNVLKRSIRLLLEGVAAGGKMAELLHKIAIDIQEQRILQRELSANVTTYVIFITFASVLAAPFLFGLSTELLLVIKSIAGNIGENATNALTVTPDAIALSDFKIFSVVLLSGTAMFSAMITGIIRKGNVIDSIRLMPAFIAVSLLLYFSAVSFFGSMFAGLV